MAGIPVTKTQLDDKVGQTALTLKKAYDDAVDINTYLVATPDADLIALGFTQADVTLIKSAYADLAYQKTTAFDSSTFVKKLWGLGI